MSLVTVSGRFEDDATDPAVGTISFTLLGEVTELDGTRHQKAVQVETLDENGDFEIDLLATLDPNLTPQGVRYAVHEQIDGDENHYEIEVPYGAAAVALANLARVQVNGTYTCAAIPEE